MPDPAADSAKASEQPTPPTPPAVVPKELSAAFKKLGIQPPVVREQNPSEKQGFMGSKNGLRQRAKKQNHVHVFMKPVKIEPARRRN